MELTILEWIMGALSLIIAGGGAGAVLYRWLGKPRVDLKESELDGKFQKRDILHAERQAKNNEFLIEKLAMSDKKIADNCAQAHLKIEERDKSIEESLRATNKKRKIFEAEITKKLDNIGRDVKRTLTLSSATAKTTVTMADELANKGHINSKTDKSIDELRAIIYGDIGETTK